MAVIKQHLFPILRIYSEVAYTDIATHTHTDSFMSNAKISNAAAVGTWI